MRIKISVAAGLLALIQAAPASAYENFIPLGTGYSANVDAVPSFGSDEGQIASQADAYETEIYVQKRAQAEEDTRFRRFFSDSEFTGSDRSIDY